MVTSGSPWAAIGERKALRGTIITCLNADYWEQNQGEINKPLHRAAHGVYECEMLSYTAQHSQQHHCSTIFKVLLFFRALWPQLIVFYLLRSAAPVQWAPLPSKGELASTHAPAPARAPAPSFPSIPVIAGTPLFQQPCFWVWWLGMLKMAALNNSALLTGGMGWGGLVPSAGH